MQYRTTSDPPLLLDTNQLAGIPKPPNPDADLIEANHTTADWMLPSALGAEPHALSVDDLLLPEDIDDPDNLPLPRWQSPVRSP